MQQKIFNNLKKREDKLKSDIISEIRKDLVRYSDNGTYYFGDDCPADSCNNIIHSIDSESVFINNGEDKYPLFEMNTEELLMLCTNLPDYKPI